MTTPPQKLETKKLYQAEVDDELFDDACDLGQFFLNPTWFVYVKICGAIGTFNRQQTRIKDAQKSKKDLRRRSSWIHLQRPFYFLFLVGGWAAVFWKVYPLLWASQHISDMHPNYSGYVVFFACLASWSFASSVSPGEINTDSMYRFDNYPYDDLLYVENSICPTLHQRKLARSKYDRYTQKHVPRFDHFCGWLRQPIGEENYREFLVFVGVHALMCTYGAILIAILVLKPDNVDDSQQQEGSGVLGMLLNDLFLTTIMVFLGSACLPLLGFFSFHMYLISKGMTTNEYYKWKLIHCRHEAATVNFHKNADSKTHQTATTAVDVEQTCNNDLTDPGPRPSNLYDLGIWKNFGEVIFPRSLQRHQSKCD